MADRPRSPILRAVLLIWIAGGTALYLYRISSQILREQQLTLDALSSWLP